MSIDDELDDDEFVKDGISKTRKALVEALRSVGPMSDEVLISSIFNVGLDLAMSIGIEKNFLFRELSICWSHLSGVRKRRRELRESERVDGPDRIFEMDS